MGTTWYTWLEQGRDVRASMEVLEAIASALRLTPAERAHLILLGRGEEAPAVQAASRARSPPRCVGWSRTSAPTRRCVLGRRWDYLAWNRAACVVFG